MGQGCRHYLARLQVCGSDPATPKPLNMAGLAMNRLAVGRSFLTFPPIRPSLPLFGSPSHRFNDALEAGSNVFVSLLKKLHLLDLSHLIANSSDCEVRNGCQVARRIS